MENKNYCKLIMVSDNNNNKFYEMIYEGGSTFTVNYGRVEASKITIQKPYGQWNALKNSKIKKGYKDVTHLTAITKTEIKEDTSDYEIIGNQLVVSFLTLMKNYTNNLVKRTYSVKAKDVTPAQIKHAQTLINKLQLENLLVNEEVNKILVELYTIIPRRMSNVKHHLIPHIKLEDILQEEQDNLDAMEVQVNLLKPVQTENNEAINKKSSLLDMLNLEMDICSDTSSFDYILTQLRTKPKGIFTVSKNHENKIFEDWLKNKSNKNTRYLIHGTRCSSVLPILETGLKIRPIGNFQFSGKVYGDGNYFSEVTSKSLNYTGNDPDKILLVYEVHIGNPFIYEGWYRGNSFPLNYNELNKRGYDTTYVKAGNGLLNSEIIAYKEEQCRIAYIIWL